MRGSDGGCKGGSKGDRGGGREKVKRINQEQ
jgi:hypothetical protein